MGDDIITGVASGTAVCLKALPIPSPLRIKKNMQYIHESEQDKKFFENLEKLSGFYVQQGLQSECYSICTPAYFKMNDDAEK